MLKLWDCGSNAVYYEKLAVYEKSYQGAKRELGAFMDVYSCVLCPRYPS